MNEKIGMYLFFTISFLGLVNSQLIPVINVANARNMSLSQCHLLPADIIFVLDDSGSVGSSNYGKEKNFVKEFVKEFDIGPRNVQFGVITFSSKSHEYIKLNMYPTKNSLLTAINKLPYESGGTNTADALSNALNQGFSLPHGDRDPVTNVLMVITDGRSQNPGSTATAAARLHKAGVTVFGIGVGAVSTKEISAIASNKEHEFHVDNFDALYKLKDDLRNKTCEAIAYSSLHCRNNIASCNVYSHTICISNAQWARQNCPLYCGYCAAQGVPTIPPSTIQVKPTFQPVTPTLPRATTTQIMTPPPFLSAVCEDKFGNCAGYGSGVCSGYRDWSIVNCARFCRFCHEKTTVYVATSSFKTPTPPCVDQLRNCAAYGSSACVFYKKWAELNCPKTCGICGFSTPSLTPSTRIVNSTVATTTKLLTTRQPSTKSTTIFNPIVTMPAVTVVGECKDHFNPGVCEGYGPNICFQLTAWAAKQCPKYCAFCTPPTTPTTPPPTTTEPPCIDVDSTCQQKGPFMCVQNRTWAQQNCRLFCLFCTPPTTAATTTPIPLTTTAATMTAKTTPPLPSTTSAPTTTIIPITSKPDAAVSPSASTSKKATSALPTFPSTIIIGRK